MSHRSQSVYDCSYALLFATTRENSMVTLQRTLMTALIATLIGTAGACGSGVEGDTGEANEVTQSTDEDSTSGVDPAALTPDGDAPTEPMNDATSEGDADEAAVDAILAPAKFGAR